MAAGGHRAETPAPADLAESARDSFPRRAVKRLCLGADRRAQHPELVCREQVPDLPRRPRRFARG